MVHYKFYTCTKMVILNYYLMVVQTCPASPNPSLSILYYQFLHRYNSTEVNSKESHSLFWHVRTWACNATPLCVLHVAQLKKLWFTGRNMFTVRTHRIYIIKAQDIMLRPWTPKLPILHPKHSTMELKTPSIQSPAVLECLLWERNLSSAPFWRKMLSSY